MELDITDFFNNACASDYSASAMELGQDAGRITWQAALDDSEDYVLLPDDNARDAFRAFVKDSGGWSEDEIAAWSDAELNALCIQWVSGDIREFRELAKGDWSEWEQLAEHGTVSGRLYGGDLSTDGRVYFSISN